MKTNTKGDVLPHSQTTQKRDENTMYNVEYFWHTFRCSEKVLSVWYTDCDLMLTDNVYKLYSELLVTKKAKYIKI